ncbi:MAG: ABC transporter permease [Brevinema sp.]
MEFLSVLLAATIRTTVPILIIALGGSFVTKSGIFNISLEGSVLIAAFVSVVFSISTNSALMGASAGVIAALVVSLVFGFFVITLKANEIVVGMGINIFAGGFTIAMMKLLYGARGSIINPDLQVFPVLDIPVLRDIPILNAILNGHTPLVYISVFLVIFVYVLFYKTKVGLYMRVAGEYEQAGSVLGINMKKIKYISVILCGILCGLAGSHLSLGYINLFAENMSAGRGLMALAALIFSNGNPISLTISCILFGFFDALSIRFQGQGVSSYLVLCVPYLVVLTFHFLVGYVRRPKHIVDTEETIKAIESTK